MEEKDISKEMMAGDEPIKREDEDLLGWGEYARLIANAVGNPTSEASMVYAINGAWGSGKSSLLNLVEQEIVKAQADNANENGRKTVIVHFEPWNCIDQNGIIRSFFDTFESVLSLWHDKNKLAQVVFGAGKVANAAGKIMQLIPAVSSLAPIFLKAGNLLSNYRKSLLEGMNNLESRKKELEHYLAEQEEIRFLFIIDDLDRLNVSEIRLLMQLMKSVCNFRNVSYLLAFDRKIVVKALDGEQTSGEGSGESYLSKIVQTTIDVPEIDSDKIESLICASLKTLFEKHGEDTRQIKGAITLIAPLFGNLRSAKRYLRETTFVLDEFKGEIDPVDLAAITAAKCIDEKAYRLFFKYQKGLLGQDPNEKEKFEKEYASTVLGRYDSNPLLYWYRSELFPHAFSSGKLIDESVANRHIWNPNILKAYEKTIPSNPAIHYKKALELLELDVSEIAKECVKLDDSSADSLIDGKLYRLLPDEKNFKEIARFAADLFSEGMDREYIFWKFSNKLLRYLYSSSFSFEIFEEFKNFPDWPLAFELASEFFDYWERRFGKNDDYKEKFQTCQKFIIGKLLENPASIFDLNENWLERILYLDSDVFKYVDAVDDPKLLRKLILNLPLGGGGYAGDETLYGVNDYVLNNLSKVRKYFHEWILQSNSLDELMKLVPAEMSASGIVPFFDEGDTKRFSGSQINEYVKRNYKEKAYLFPKEYR